MLARQIKVSMSASCQNEGTAGAEGGQKGGGDRDFDHRVLQEC